MKHDKNDDTIQKRHCLTAAKFHAKENANTHRKKNVRFSFIQNEFAYQMNKSVNNVMIVN